jgi:hypothetical protein
MEKQMKASYFIDKFLLSLVDRLKISCSTLVLSKALLIKIALPLFVICCGFYSCTCSHKLVERDIIDIFLVSDIVREAYVSKPDYWGLSTKELLNQSIVPNTYIRQGHLVLSSGKEILLGKGATPDIVMPRSQTFDIVIKDLTKGECMTYAEYSIPQEDIIKLQQIQIVNDAVYTFEWGGENSLPVKKYTTKDMCKKQGNILIWTMK